MQPGERRADRGAESKPFREQLRIVNKTRSLENDGGSSEMISLGISQEGASHIWRCVFQAEGTACVKAPKLFKFGVGRKGRPPARLEPRWTEEGNIVCGCLVASHGSPTAPNLNKTPLQAFLEIADLFVVLLSLMQGFEYGHLP